MTSPTSSKTAKFMWHTAREGMALVAENGIIKNANPAFCEALGYTDNELQGMHISEITHTEDQEASDTKFKELISGKVKSYTMNKRWRSKFGKEMIGELFARKWHDSVLIYLSLMPWCSSASTTVRAVMDDAADEKSMDELIGRLIRTLPAKAIKSRKFWTYILSALGGIAVLIEYIRDFKDLVG